MRPWTPLRDITGPATCGTGKYHRAAVITSQGTTLQVKDRFAALRKTEDLAGPDVKDLADQEQHHILQVLQKTGWRIEGNTGAALLLGLNPSTLRARMWKYVIRRS